MNANVARLLDYLERKHPRSHPNLIESREQAPVEFDRIAGIYLDWCLRARGIAGLEEAADAFARFCSDVNMSQGRYELAGRYESKSFEDCRRAVYDDSSTMDGYLWGVYLSNFLWAHHFDLMRFFEQRFLSGLAVDSRLVELAPGHGGWGLWALRCLSGSSLQGYDVSATSIQIARSLAKAAELDARTAYEQRDVMDIGSFPSPQADACICSFVVEHLERPDLLLRSMAHVLKPGALAFFTGALTAAQVDHIFEFKSESELVLLAEQAGFRVLETRSVSPRRLIRNAKFLPRSMALILKKRTHDHW